VQCCRRGNIHDAVATHGHVYCRGRPVGYSGFFFHHHVATGITQFAQFGGEDLSALQEKTVKIVKEEALRILAASLKSKTVLTDVFLKSQE
uniref:Uncharacterized protein n=1 Tax=Aegilops tauschii subsp. strangulata TaxID=200361 RepID=A0A453E2E0_AEGTS